MEVYRTFGSSVPNETLYCYDDSEDSEWRRGDASFAAERTQILSMVSRRSWCLHGWNKTKTLVVTMYLHFFRWPRTPL